MSKKKIHKFKSEIWLYQGAGAWHFASLPKNIAIEIKSLKKFSRGWGSYPVKVTIGKTSWTTSIFPDSKNGTYLLPIKSEVRKKEKITAGDKIEIILELK